MFERGVDRQPVGQVRLHAIALLLFHVHIGGLRARHDELVSKQGVFDEAIAAIGFLKEKDRRVTTTCSA